MELTVQKREITGKKISTVREKGLIPAELYGRGMENVHLSVPMNEFSKVFKEAGENTVVNLKVGPVKSDSKSDHGASATYPVIIHDIQRDYVQGSIQHIDFYKVRLDEKIKAKIPLEFVGESAAVKALGAVLSKSVLELEVEALPTDLPHRLTVDISLLDELNKSVYVKDVMMPKGVEVLVDPETAIVTAALIKEEVVEAAPVADVTAVKVETEEKKEERATEKASKEEKK